MNTKNTKTVFLFNDFLSSVAGEPLEIRYKNMAHIFKVSESTLSKFRHGKLTKIPVSMHPDTMAAHFAGEVMQLFTQSDDTVRRFASYARILNENYFCTEDLSKSAAWLANVGPIDAECAKKLYSSEIPQLIQHCYEEAYANTQLDYTGNVVSRSSIQSEISYQKICDTINHDTFDNEKLKQLLNVVYAANIRRQIATYFSSQSFLELVDRCFRNQANQPFYTSVNRTEIISISEDSTKIMRTIKGQKQIVLQTLRPQQIVFKQSLNHFVNMSTQEIVKNAFQNFTCTINHIPLVTYINMHENTHYTSLVQFASTEQTRDSVGGTVITQLAFRFNLYPKTIGETINIFYGYTCTTPFIQNVSCNYSYSLRFPCKFFEHEFMLDAKTRAKWGVRVKLFTPMTTSVYNAENSEDLYSKSNGTSDSKRITFYDWAMPGAGYYRNLYELEYTNDKTK